MPRSSSNSRNSSTSTQSRPSLPPPKIWHQSPPMLNTPAPQQSFGSIVKEGIGFGAGAEVGRTAVQGLFGLFKSSNQTMPPPAAIQPPHFADPNYKQCMEYTKNDEATCRPFLSKDSSPWKQCMEANFYQKEYCNNSSPDYKVK